MRGQIYTRACRNRVQQGLNLPHSPIFSIFNTTFYGNSHQVTRITHEQLVGKDLPYRKMLALIDFRKLCAHLQKYNRTIHEQQGYGIVTLFKALLLQFMQELSDREMQRFLEENTAAKYFCGFNMEEKTPYFTLLSKVRERIGTPAIRQAIGQSKGLSAKAGLSSPSIYLCRCDPLSEQSPLMERTRSNHPSPV